MQLDIFDHSRDVMLRNDLIDALLLADPAAAARARRALEAEFAGDAGLAAAGVLVAALDSRLDSRLDAAFADSRAVLAARSEIEGVLAPAARQLLRAAAGAWLAPHWARLARCAAGREYEAAAPQAHSAALWIEAACWGEAAQAVQGIESWRRIPQPLAWMAQARWHLEGQDAALPLLTELAWLAPQRLPALLRGLPDIALHKLLRRFESEFESDFESDAAGPVWAWWPAWALIEQPLLAGPMTGAEATQGSAAERAWQVVQALLRIERRGSHHELMAHRRQLRDLSPALFQSYMKTR